MTRRMRTFPAIPQSVHAARRFAVDALPELPERALESVELMVSELATNCIRHERTSFHVAVLHSARQIRVEVTDAGLGVPMMRSPGPDEPSGRGLQIVHMLSDQWGVQPETPSGKTVWFTLNAPAGREVGGDRAGSRHREDEEAPPIGQRPPTVQSRRGSAGGSDQPAATRAGARRA